MTRFNPLDHPITLALPHRLTDIVDWHQHIPFAFTLVEVIKPRLFVELGTYKGDSFCAVCQAVSTMQVGTLCVAIDSWLGDIHTGSYGNDVYEELLAYQREHYGSFASLIRSTFDNAVSRFDDSSIDLLHIDGTHTYEAVKHDFELWIGKMSDRGVVMFHDTNERQEGFGVFRLWKELKQRYLSCEFPYGHGLGVVAIGAEVPEGLESLFQAIASDPTAVRYFQILGERIIRTQRDQELVTLLRGQITETQSRYDEMVGTLDLRTQELVELRERVEALEAQASVYVGEIAQLEMNCRRLERQNDWLQTSIAQHGTGITPTTAQSDRVGELEDELQKRDAELSDLRSSRTFRTAQLIQRPIRRARKLLGNWV